MKTLNQRAWLLVLPVVALVAFNAVLPLMTVVNYSVQEIFYGSYSWKGLDWYQWVLTNDQFQQALTRQLLFTFLVLAIQIPLGIAVALCMPKKGFWVPVCLVTMALPLLIPWNVVGSMWNIMSLPNLGLLGWGLPQLGWDYNMSTSVFDTWVTVILMDVWHWTSLVVLLAYAGLVSIPDAYYQAAKIDGAGRWAVFRHIQLPKMKRVLIIAILLRFMDSFMIYTEVIVLTGGANGTEFLSIDLVNYAQGQQDQGKAGAYSLIYFLMTLLVSWVFYTVMTRNDAQEARA